MSERIMIFIDGSNLYHSLKNHFNRADLDMGKFTAKLLNKRPLVRIYYYNAMVGQKQEPELFKQQQAFFNGVNATPYTEVRLGRLVYSSGWPNVPPTEKGTDVQLAVDLVTHAYRDNYDIAILVAGDNDFTGAVQAAKDSGKHVEIALFGNPGTSQQLRDVADKIIQVDGKTLKDCWTRGSQRQRHRAQPETTTQTETPPQAEAPSQPPAEEPSEQPSGEAGRSPTGARNSHPRRVPAPPPLSKP